MDLLDRILMPGRNLLRRVDQTLATAGIPPDHEIVPRLRAVGALPGEALEWVGELRQDPFAELAVQLRNHADGYAARRAQVDAEVARTTWEGAAGDAFLAYWRNLGQYLGDGERAEEPSMAGRLSALRAYLADVCDWITAARNGFAVTLGEVIGSAEAVRMAAEPDVAAATAIGLKVLKTADEALRDGFGVAARWQYQLGDLPFQIAEPGLATSRPARIEL